MLHSDQPHILVIDDDERIRTLVTRYLWKNEFVSIAAANAQEAKDILKNFEVDLIVADVMMPGQTGFEFTNELRARNDNRPIILLTALGEVENRIEGFEKGADDYLPKPFDPKELVLRIKALLKRVPKNTEAKKVQIGPYWFDVEQSLLSRDEAGNKQVMLTELEAKLLSSLLKTPNDPVSREVLAERCDMSGTERAIDVQVTRLRKKLEEDPSNPRLLKTVRGKGYMLRVV